MQARDPASVPADVAVKTPARKFYDEAQRTLIALARRWQDERDHEDIDDYMTVLQPIAAVCAVRLIKMTREPLGVKFEAQGRTFHLTLDATGDYSYRQVTR